MNVAIRQTSKFWISSLILMAVLGCKEPVENKTLSHEQGPVPNIIAFNQAKVLERVAEYRSVIPKLSLEDQHKQKLIALLTEYEETMLDLYGRNTANVREYNRQLNEILKEINEPSRRRAERLFEKGIGKEVLGFRKQESKLLKSFHQQLEAMIPSNQVQRWKTHCIVYRVLVTAEPLALTASQVDAIEELAPKALLQVGPGMQRHWRSEGTIQLENMVRRSVLNHLQSEQYTLLKNQTQKQKNKKKGEASPSFN